MKHNSYLRLQIAEMVNKIFENEFKIIVTAKNDTGIIKTLLFEKLQTKV